MKNKIIVLASLLCFSASAQKPGINLANMDTSVSPAQDFYTYCNGTWQKNFQLPESDSRFGSFNEIHEANLVKIKRIYDAIAKSKPAAGTDAERLRNFYVTAMDSVKAEKLGFTPLTSQMQMIERVNNAEDFLRVKAQLENMGIQILFSSYVAPDLKNSKKNRFYLVQAGYGLGDRDYYHSRQHEKIRTEYGPYLHQLFMMAGTEAKIAENYAGVVLDFETRLTEKALSRVEQRDLDRQYNMYSRDMLKSLTPGINWEIYFKEKGIDWPDSVNVNSVEYLQNASEMLSKLPLKALKAYAQAQLLMEAAPYLNERASLVHFNFRGKTMSGAQVMKSRWQRVHSVINNTIGEIVSKEFVKQHFPATSKQKVNQLIDNLILSYRDRIDSRDWMSAETKKQAHRKLDLLIRKIGYPDKWKDYKGLIVGTQNYWENVCKVNSWLVSDNLSELKKPVDRYKWQMTPITVNAYYDPTTNEITFPAAILQPPFYDAQADDAANYGTMGSIIGHELTHGFDDMGARFDADGNMKMWWTDTDYKNFTERTGKIVKQFNDYVAIDTLHVNGEMTQGENIADLGGLTMAYYAYKKSLNGKPSPVIGGFTGEQRFFIAWAQGWKSKTRDEELKRLLTIDYHAPAYFRAFAPLTNMKEFHEAFGVKPGDKMHRTDIDLVEIW